MYIYQIYTLIHSITCIFAKYKHKFIASHVYLSNTNIHLSLEIIVISKDKCCSYIIKPKTMGHIRYISIK